MKISMCYPQIIIISVILGLLQVGFSLQCKISSSNSTKILGGPAIICLHLQLPSEASPRTYAFNVTVDKFSALTVTGLNDLLKIEQKTIKATLQFENNETLYAMNVFVPAANGVKALYRDVYSFVVNLEGGNFTKISLDNAKCDVCDTADGTQYCQVDTDECFTTSDGKYGGDSPQNPKFFISWVGTDSDSNHMLSHARRLSRFTQYSVGSIYQKAKALVVS